MTNGSIVLFKNSPDEVKKVLRCVDSSSLAQIYIIDNSPTDRLREIVLDVSLKAQYIFGHGNVGYGAGHNIGIRKSLQEGCTYHTVLNPDIYFEKNTIERLSSFMDEHPQAGAVMPKVLYPDGEIQYLCKLLPTPSDLLLRRFLPFKKLKERNNFRYELRESGYNRIMNVPCLSGCFMFLRVKALEEVGLFDETFFMYGEDFDLYRRIHRKYQTLFYPEVTVIHEHKKESYKNKTQLKLHIKSMIHYFNKWGWAFDSERKKANRKILEEISNTNA